MNNGFKVGDTVEWTSQSQASTKTKRGVIVDVVPVGGIPPRRWADLYTGAGVGLMGRPHESYVVEVPHGKKSIRHYWPRVKHLHLVGESTGEKK